MSTVQIKRDRKFFADSSTSRSRAPQMVRRYSRAAFRGFAAVIIICNAACDKPETSRLLDASVSTERSPDVFRVRFETTKGPFVVETHRDWAPIGADRFYYLVRNGYYDGTRFFRALDGFMAQFGISGVPAIAASWKDRRMPDDSATQQNLRGRVSWANAGPGTRTTQLFINYRDNAMLDNGHYPPIGQVVEGMSVVDSLYKGYGEGMPYGKGPDQDRLYAQGEKYLASEFPKLDKINKAEVVK
jgi:peptidyl-prolyl cis-trans isomerase A (cyclophilin A)